ncbi:MAG: hypothetical protein IPG93_07735 [Burkholderiales bacterium]|nr:hypothetical protein [Burkholderiales bacterium]
MSFFDGIDASIDCLTQGFCAKSRPTSKQRKHLPVGFAYTALRDLPAWRMLVHHRPAPLP